MKVRHNINWKKIQAKIVDGNIAYAVKLKGKTADVALGRLHRMANQDTEFNFDMKENTLMWIPHNNEKVNFQVARDALERVVE